MKKPLSLLSLVPLLSFAGTTDAFWSIPRKNIENEISPISIHDYFLNKFWDDNFVRIPPLALEASSNSYPLDLVEKDDDIIAIIDVPNFAAEDISIKISDGKVLSISGNKSEEKEDEEVGKYFYRERNSGSFYRSFTLPSVVDKSKTTADFEDGTLTITMPKVSSDELEDTEIKINNL